MEIFRDILGAVKSPFSRSFSFPRAGLALGCVALGWGWAPVLGLTPQKPTYIKPVDVQEPSRMREWRYIVIHHSGSSTGNEVVIQQEHLKRGMENGMAYHFLIGNGSMGLSDGEVVEGRRWKYQLQGGHCHQDFLNQCGIGICLVGNCNRTAPTAKQVGALAALVFRLQSQFQISDDNIHGHGQFYGEDSDCPGRNFPWNTVWTKLNEAYLAQTNSAPPDASAFRVSLVTPR